MLEHSTFSFRGEFKKGQIVCMCWRGKYRGKKPVYSNCNFICICICSSKCVCFKYIQNEDQGNVECLHCRIELLSKEHRRKSDLSRDVSSSGDGGKTLLSPIAPTPRMVVKPMNFPLLCIPSKYGASRSPLAPLNVDNNNRS